MAAIFNVRGTKGKAVPPRDGGQSVMTQQSANAPGLEFAVYGFQCLQCGHHWTGPLPQNVSARVWLDQFRSQRCPKCNADKIALMSWRPS
jgi:hypothetical protein